MPFVHSFRINSELQTSDFRRVVVARNRLVALDHRRRELAELRVVVADDGEAPRLPLRDRVERDRLELVVRERVREALQDALGVLLLLRVREVHRREDLVEDLKQASVGKV